MPHEDYCYALERETEDLRKQLAALKSELKTIGKAVDDPRTDLTRTISEIIIELKQQLADTQKREVMMRGYLEKIAFSRVGKHKNLAQELFDREDWAVKALAATADLDGLILCHAEPVRYIYEYPYWDGSSVWRDKPSFDGVNANKSMPLYRAREPKP